MVVLKFMLKFVSKILLLPVAAVLIVLLGIVKMMIALYGMFHSIVAFFLGILFVAVVLSYRDLVTAAFVAVLCGISFLVLTAGVMAEVLLEEGIGVICGFIML